MRYQPITRALIAVTLLCLYGCGGKTTTQQESTTPSAAQEQATSSAPVPSPAPPVKTQPAPPARTQARLPKAAAPAVPQKQAASAAPVPAPEPILVDAGTVLEVTLDQSLSSKTSGPGDRFDASLAAPVIVGGKQVIPSGAKASGTVTAAESAGRMTGSASLKITLDSITANGQTYRIRTAAVEETSGGRGKRTAIGAGAGAAAGAIIGAITGGGKGAAIGAGAGAGAGTAGAALTGEREITLPAETRLSFKLTEPLSIR
jgi:hypothetical protein